MVRAFFIFMVFVLTTGLTACSVNDVGTAVQDSLSELSEPGNQIIDRQTVEATQEIGVELRKDSDLSEDVYESPDIGTTLIFWHGMVDSDILVLRDIVKNFQLQNPDVQIDLEYIPYDDLYNRYVEGIDSGEGPSMIFGSGEWGPVLYENGLVADLTNFEIIEAETGLMPSAIEEVTYQGSVIGVPISASGQVMYRNASIQPVAPQTFVELISLSQTITKGGLIGAYLERGALFAFPQLSACGGRLMLDSGFPAFNNQTGLCWLQLLRSYEEAGPVSYNLDDDLQRFMEGKVGIIIDGTWNLDLLSDNLGENLKIDMWPRSRDDPLNGYVWTENIYINPGLDGATMDAAVLFSKFLLSPEPQTKLAGLGVVPVRMNLSGLPDLMNQTSQILSTNIPYPTNPVFRIYSQVFNDLLKDFYQNRISPNDMLQAASERIYEATHGNVNPQDDF